MELTPTPDSPPESNIFSVRIVSIDYYMAPPISGVDICYSSFQGEKVNEVPVIRIYGSTPGGQKTCLHLHQALPYLYVPCEDIPLQASQEVDAYTHAISLAIEKSLKLKGNAGAKRQHVHGCSLVRARRFYGYHASEELFVKIYLYHPHDVLRAAKLLLGGAVFDRSAQPHEAHIPYLLQFLIDYNLSGMGHLHLTKLKFRNPTTDSVLSDRSKDNVHLKQGNDAFLCKSAALKADSIAKAHLRTAVWTTSTIPPGWRWQKPDEFDSLSDQNTLGIKCQSICELEGDAIVDDIVNQQFKTYTSLSQARSDVKMVQSLVPIWEEEYDRSGMHEAAPPDPGKPKPEDVLRVLSLGLELEDKFMELSVEAENTSTPLDQSLRSVSSTLPLSDERKLSDFANADTSNKFGERLQQFEIKDDSLSLQNLWYDHKLCTMPGKGEDTCHEPFSVKESSPSTQALERKVADKEALGLLKWLATTQAVEDINSDDELAREIILSPLLPATTVDKVLEKANMDYESESQRECQDILDSIDETMDIEGLKETILRDSCQALSKKMIPQVDGSGEDPFSSGEVETSLISEKKSESRILLEQEPLHDDGKSAGRKRRLMGSSWGKLPFSMTSEEVDHFGSINTSVNDGFTCVGSDQNPEGSGCNNQTGALNCTDTAGKELETGPIHLKDASMFDGCSVRDLMRKKRQYQFMSSASHGQQKIDVSSCPEHSNSHLLDDEDCSMQFRSCPDIQKARDEVCDEKQSCSGDFTENLPVPDTLGLDILGYEEGYEPDAGSWKSTTAKFPQIELSEMHGEELPHVSNKPLISDVVMSTSNKLVKEAKFITPVLASMEPIDVSAPACTPGSAVESKLVGMGAHCSDTYCGGRTLRACSREMTLNNLGNDKGVSEATVTQNSCDGEPELRDSAGFSAADARISTGLITLTFHEKPPNVDWDDKASGNVSFAKATEDHSSFLECYSDHRIPMKAMDEIPSFFTGGFRVGNKLQDNNDGDGESSNQQEAFMGVPTHYLNDGSQLYLLTHVHSPPSVGIVRDWLHNKEGIRSLSGCSEPLVGSKGSPTDDCDGVSEPSSLCDPMDTDPSQEKQRDMDAEMNVHNSGVAITLQIEESITKQRACKTFSQDNSQISGPAGKSGSTPLSQLGFCDPASVGAGQQLTILSIEVQAESRGDLQPDPRFDAINVIALAIMRDDDSHTEIYVLLNCRTESCQRSRDGLPGCKVLDFQEEKQLLIHFVQIIRDFDPDILVGWDVQGGSLGFLAERASYLGIGLLNLVSRTPSEAKDATGDSEHLDKRLLENVSSESFITGSVSVEDAIIEDEWGRTHASGVHVGGRIVLNLWRLMRGEVKLNMYTLEAVAEAVLRQKIPSINHKILTKWFSSCSGRARYRCIEHMIKRASLNLKIINQLDLVNRTSELARVFGIDFFSVLSRGSQYRVESMFLRLAHTQNYVAISPGNQQVASQPAMECLPLVMEPESGLYGDPVVVLDFQSLYPSMIIAYNLCFCTCLGKVSPAKDNTLGVASYSAAPNVLRNLKDQLLLAPNGAMYVPAKVRKGVLPRLLEEILSTRIMVKQAMKKLDPSQNVLHRIFNARQLALKLIANVTYGYTAAGFSGRMPCAELADSIVQCGRRTLENAISYVNAHNKWDARVIYGDTDSMFVLLKGRNVKEAFRIGQEIASAISGMNPEPVVLKMEKVYHPCFLLTKKRYVGYSYESPDQIEPTFDAKGIETVRRDTCAAVAKAMEQCLRLYFEHQDISEIKSYLYRQWTRILSGRVSLQDFVFAKEVRLGTYSTRPSSSLPPAAIVATKAMRVDPRAEPRYAERIPYVVVHGEPGARLVDMVVDPLDVLALDSPYRLNGSYYITKQIIPALQRVFGLVGVDLNQWYLEMPRPTRERNVQRPLDPLNPQRTRIDYYYLSRHCVLCGEIVPTSESLCGKCSQKSSVVAAALTGKTSKLEREMQHLAAICRHCGGGDWILESGIKCTSLVCPVFFERRKVQKELRSISAVAAEKGFYPKCTVEWF